MNYGFCGGVTILAVGVILAIYGVLGMKEKLEVGAKLMEHIPA